MSELVVEHIFPGEVAAVFRAIRQYQRYPDYVPGVTAIQVLPPVDKGSTCQVRYDLKLIKSFHYTLNMFEESPTKIWWNLAESNLMKRSSGSWTLAPLEGKRTRAVYTLDVGFSTFIPQKVVDQLTKANIPLLMSGMERLIRDVSPE